MKLSIRSMIRATKGFSLVAVDLSQAESWIVAYLANEPNMKRALQFGDIHTETAGNALFFSNTGCNHDWKKLISTIKKEWHCSVCQRIVTELMRYVGKRYNHASSYRMEAVRAAEVINKDSDKPPYFTVTIKESKEFSTAWHAYYNLKLWWSDIERQLNETRSLTTPYGRKRIFFGAWGNELFKEATAFVPQATVAAHFNGQTHPELGIRGGLKEIYRQLVKPYVSDGHKIINQSHDSCILEVPSVVSREIGQACMRLVKRPLVINGEMFTIPVDGEIGERWGELVKLKEAV